MTVSVPTLWLIAAVVLGLSELLVGTFYLLLLGVAALVGALAAFAGFALEIQCLIAAAVVLVGGVILARYRAHHKKDARGLANDNLDIGQTVTVAHWNGLCFLSRSAVEGAYGASERKNTGYLHDCRRYRFCIGFKTT